MTPTIIENAQESLPSTGPSNEEATSSLLTLMNQVSAPPKVSERFTPPVPETLADAGLSDAAIEQLILKHLYFRDELIGRELSDALGLKFSLIEDVVEGFKRHHIVQVKGSLGFGAVSSMFTLSELGRSRARECLERNQYCGPAPVPVAQYVKAVRSQKLPNGWLTRKALEGAFGHMVVHPDVISQVGPAVNSGKSFLIYGQPGNGKTYLAEALFRLESPEIYVPYALENEGKIIRVYDPLYHQLADGGAPEEYPMATARTYDGRWARCRRPFIVTGGELTLAMLDLSFNPISKIYDAPFQLKANNGIYLIDDFGRQQVSPKEVLNRWIVPMDRKVDYLTFVTGGKIEIPFETFLIFSTNLKPEQFGDEAFLRRIAYKMLLRSPDESEFTQIFSQVCAKQGVTCATEQIHAFIEKHYRQAGKRFRRCQPGDLIAHAIDLINFDGLPMQLNEDVLGRAFASCFVHTETDD